MTAYSGPSAGGFFSRLFDFSFSTFVTTSVVKVLYFLGLLTGVLFCIGIIAALAQVGGGYVAVGIIAAIIVFFLWAVWIRVGLETVIILFRIAENTAVSARAAGGPDLPAGPAGMIVAPPPAQQALPRPAAAAARGRITVMDNGVPRPERSLAAGSSLVVGSAMNCDIVLSDPSIYAQHVRIELVSGSWRVTDLSGTAPPEVMTQSGRRMVPSGGSEVIALGEVRLGASVIGLHAVGTNPFAR